MIPIGGVQPERIERSGQPSRTYRLDWAQGRIAGETDGLDAVRQAVFKILRTGRYRHAIYSSGYGHELDGLLGGHPVFVESEAVRLLTEALRQDDRITGIENLAIEMSGDRLTASFTVLSIYGSYRAREVI